MHSAVGYLAGGVAVLICRELFHSSIDGAIFGLLCGAAVIYYRARV